MDNTDIVSDDLVETASRIVSAYVSNNHVAPEDLTNLIKSTHQTLVQLSRPEPEPVPELPSPAVSVRKSVTPDFIVCLEDGRKFKSLRRHLSKLGMTPDEYRLKWGLPESYPMVAPNYSAHRSALAKQNGLGREATASKPRGRKKKLTLVEESQES
ncbi:MAG: MucR family transcriptional regulator [Candidatus Devosia phytovorans]|uniref:MucR family transcriptional regulator n=1 Tax=Candidatus Devosia phytovorans TaxID=3121372 RepID=A0AAJ6AY62_9HYPH|nr:MucR family transcriptional regulator [Devosia sp.]WEK03215.1 MAG: MucR family transcriptional regulator [Devosia sp.]